MTDDNGDDVQKYKRVFGGKCGQDYDTLYALALADLPSQLHKDIWNRAIEKAALIADDGDEYSAAQIRKLKV